jgi:1-acyl-sn-glycerol-3-phosphate acyltransferase
MDWKSRCWLGVVGSLAARTSADLIVLLPGWNIPPETAGSVALFPLEHLLLAYAALAILLSLLLALVGPVLDQRQFLWGSVLWSLGVLVTDRLLGGLAGWERLGIAAGQLTQLLVTYALLPRLVEATGVPLLRGHSILAAALLLGAGGGALLTRVLPTVLPLLPLPEAALGLYVLALGLAGLGAAAFPALSLLSLREAAGRWLAALGAVGRDGVAQGSLWGAAGFFSLAAVPWMDFLQQIVARGGNSAGISWSYGTLVGALSGCFLLSLQGHLRRGLGLVPLAASGLVALGLFLGKEDAPLTSFWGGAWGFCAVWACVPLAAHYHLQLLVREQPQMLTLFVPVACLLSAGLLHGATTLENIWGPGFSLLLGTTLATAVAALAAWYWLGRNFLEQLLEWLVWPCYRIHGQGPGLACFPLQGPVLVLSNHTSWFDPVWLGKVLPRKLTPMMTSLFYDLPGLHFLMKYVVRAIRVQAASFRREVPELQEAIRILDEGGCVVLFPEGACRKSETELLRPFGQGVWHILRQRPQTPVVLCWIEGGWGSFWSYAGGPPLRHKYPDFWRRIDIAVSPPQVVPAEILAHHRRTRDYLRRCCAATRSYLGLPIPRLEDEVLEETKSQPASEPHPENE